MVHRYRMNDKITDPDADGTGEDPLESFDENLSTDPVRKGNHKLVLYAALALFAPCAAFLLLQSGRHNLIPFMGFDIDMVVAMIALLLIFIAFWYRDGY